MFRNLGRNAPVEADHIVGDLLQRRRTAIANHEGTSYLAAAYTHLKAYEMRRARSLAGISLVKKRRLTELCGSVHSLLVSVTDANLDIRESIMNKLTYRVVKHDGGWAYEANGTYSEPFPTREAARKAAKLAASEQAEAGKTTQISYEDEKGRWHNEIDIGTDRPRTTVEG
jgi:hypothetical protein